MKKFLPLLSALVMFSSGYSLEKDTKIGVVNFTTCISESKAGKEEQAQLEKIKTEGSQRIQEKQKRLDALEEKSNNQDYMDGLSPDAAKAHKAEEANLKAAIDEEKNQLYQTMNQAQYFLLHKLYRQASKAAENVASQKGFDLIQNSETFLYLSEKYNTTKDVIAEMDKLYDQERAKEKTAVKETAVKSEKSKEKAKEETSKAAAEKMETSKKK